jgi:hypothetical protein
MVFAQEKIDVFKSPKIEKLLWQEFMKRGHYPNGVRVTALPDCGLVFAQFIIEKSVGHQKWFAMVNTKTEEVFLFEMSGLNQVTYEP